MPEYAYHDIDGFSRRSAAVSCGFRIAELLAAFALGAGDNRSGVLREVAFAMTFGAAGHMIR